MDKKLYIITKGEYKGRVGIIDKNLPGWKIGNVMFYPIEKSNLSRVCIRYADVKPVEE